MFYGEQPPLFFVEIGVRAVVVLVAAMLILKLTGKRTRRELTSFDLLVAIALGSAVGDVMFYPEVPLAYAVVALLVVTLFIRLLSWIGAQSSRVHDFIVSNPTLLIRDGEYLMDAVEAERLAMDEVRSMLREQGVENVGEVRRGYMELSGAISVFRFPEGERIDGQSTLPDES